jgi:hypothetical protein
VGALLDAKASIPAATPTTTSSRWPPPAAPAGDRVQQVLDMASLDRVAGQQTRGYSMGMAQRLGIAAELLGDPAVVMLDEPGQRPRPGRHPLDPRPASRAEMRVKRHERLYQHSGKHEQQCSSRLSVRMAGGQQGLRLGPSSDGRSRTLSPLAAPGSVLESTHGHRLGLGVPSRRSAKTMTCAFSRVQVPPG